MMFAGLTSAYIVKRQQPGWISFEIPRMFWLSTTAMLASSLAVQMALKAFKDRHIKSYKNLILLTAVLGMVFIILQILGFQQIWKTGLTFSGAGAAQFLYAIAGLHVLHVFGGVITMLVMFLKSLRKTSRSYNSVPIEVASTYWHFVDALWVYLFIFFLVIH
ncbi:MAG: cytochrome c oxidase subunit 3 [Bacteroidetes bacterium]|nr:cytochrome c oxidase subunit 3 [Bacteroidota bacterium]MBS1974333.1 cytochrome c oxidase subunit 3 [Bacteroidota bacterium]